MSDEDGRDERYRRGWQRFSEVNGEASDKIVETISELAPDLARYAVEFAYGDLYNRPGLDVRTREIVTLAALASMGNAPAQLRAHIHGALNVGVTREEIVEIMIQTTAISGFANAINGVHAAREVFAARDRLAEKS